MGTQRGLIAALVLFVIALTIYLMTQKPPGIGDSGKHAAAPEVTLMLEPGAKSLLLSSLKGKVVLLDFWATWCGPCKMSIPEVERLYKKYQGKGVEVVGVSLDEPSSQPNIPAVQKALGMTYPIMIATKAPEILQKYGAGSIPTLYVIDKRGDVRLVSEGFDPNKGLTAVEDLVDKLRDE
jgi:thiol-disulfide isomerase/thioredoxin